MKRILILFLLTIFLGSCQEKKPKKDTYGIESIADILYEGKAVDYFSAFVDLNEGQKSNISFLARQYTAELKQMPKEERNLQLRRYLIKYFSHIVRDVMTMEQAESYIAKDPNAQQMFTN